MPEVMEKPKKEKEKKPEKVDLSAPLALAVLEQLGKPSNLREVRVHSLWDNRYRVNVWCNINNDKGKNPLYDTQKISDSFFVVASPEGGIMSCTPPIKRKYDNTPAVGKPKPTNVADILVP